MAIDIIWSLIGLTEEEAANILSGTRLYIRPTKIDGESLIITMDQSPIRINVHLENGKIVHVYRG